MKKSGFTVVEVVVVIIVLAILATISMVSYRGLQVSARDKEREADVQAIATHLENIYSQKIMHGSTTIKAAGSYPSKDAMTNSTYSKVILNGLARGADTQSWSSSGESVIKMPTTTTPAYDAGEYRYIPQQKDGSICTSISQECRSFKIYYQLESDSGVNKEMESKRK